MVSEVMRSGAALDLRIAFVGAGPVAATLARAMHLAGLRVATLFSRDRRKAEDVAARVPGALVAASAQAAADTGDIVFLRLHCHDRRGAAAGRPARGHLPRTSWVHSSSR
jgi:3-hydroxyisobutyrate dehydrogenase-like beta-hydroxyacid dehydrogenase